MEALRKSQVFGALMNLMLDHGYITQGWILLECTSDQPNFRQAACDFDVAYELDPKVHPKLEERRFFGVLIVGFWLLGLVIRRFDWRVFRLSRLLKGF